MKGVAYFIRRKHYPLEKDALIRRKLAERVTLTFKDVPLKKLLRDLDKKLGFTIVIDRQSLADEGIDPETKITRTFRNIRLRTVLEEIVTPLNLTLFTDEGTLFITTAAVADERLFSAIIDISHLTESGVDADRITDMLQQETSGPWFDIDGIGGTLDINSAWGVAIVRQTEKVLSEIAVLLADTKSAFAEAAKHRPKTGHARND